MVFTCLLLKVFQLRKTQPVLKGINQALNCQIIRGFCHDHSNRRLQPQARTQDYPTTN